MSLGHALAIVGGLTCGIAASCAIADEMPCPQCSSLLAIPALEEVPEHAFGWAFGDPTPICRLASDSRLRRDGPPIAYRGEIYRKVFVLAGACSGHAGWLTERDVQRWHGPMPAGAANGGK